MLSIENTQAKIKNATHLYKTKYPDEYKAVTEVVRQKRSQLKHKTGAIDGDHAVQRVLVEYPEDLDVILLKNLDEEEYKWFGTKIGKRWFAKEFPEFRVAEDL